MIDSRNLGRTRLTYLRPSDPGIMPSLSSIKGGEVGRKQAMLAEVRTSSASRTENDLIYLTSVQILEGCLRATYLPDVETGRAFAPHALISNPPAFAHIHLAEYLGIPLQLSFSRSRSGLITRARSSADGLHCLRPAMPWSPTVDFCHPLVQLRSNAPAGISNYLSFAIADKLTWTGYRAAFASAKQPETDAFYINQAFLALSTGSEARCSAWTSSRPALARPSSTGSRSAHPLA